MSEAVINGLSDTLLVCLCAELAVNPSPPKYCCLRAGQQVAEDIGTRFGDECCEGLGYVRVDSIFPSRNFPQQDDEPIDCLGAYAVTFELGVFRCAPDGGTGLVPCTSWTGTARQLMHDAQAMRKAVCCLVDALPPGTGVLPGQWTPLGPAGGCTGGIMEVTVQVALDPCNC